MYRASNMQSWATGKLARAHLNLHVHCRSVQHRLHAMWGMGEDMIACKRGQELHYSRLLPMWGQQFCGLLLCIIGRWCWRSSVCEQSEG